MANYIDNDRLFEVICRWKESGKTLNDFEDGTYIGESIIAICEGVARLKRFAGYSYVDEMILEAIAHVCRYVDRFNPDISHNPFAYISQIAYFNFQSFLKKEKKQREIQLRAMSDSTVLGDILSEMGSESEVQAMVENVQLMLKDAGQLTPIEKRKSSTKKRIVPNTFLSGMMES